MNAISTNITMTVTLSQLRTDPGINSRLFGKEDEIAELAASIKANGLLQTLLVRPTTEDGVYSIVDGERRFAALSSIGGNPEVQVIVRPMTDAEARDHSLTANIIRLPLHPADQFVAFKAMHDAGIDAAEIATRYSLSTKTVEQRLALGSVLPEMLDLYRQGKVDQDIIKAFAGAELSRQERAFREVTSQKHWQTWSLRQAIATDTILSTDEKAKFIGRKLYVGRGGQIESDLFQEVERWTSADLIAELVAEVMDKTRDKLLKQGWSWVKHETEIKGSIYNMGREQPTYIVSSKDKARYDELNAMLKAYDDDDDLEEVDAEPADVANAMPPWKIQQELTKIEARSRHEWSAEQMANSGVVITNSFEIRYGMVDKKHVAKSSNGAVTESADAENEAGGISMSLQDDLSAVLSTATQFAIASNPTLAHDLLVLSLIDQVQMDFTAPLAINIHSRYDDANHPVAASAFDKYLQSRLAAFQPKAGHGTDVKLDAVRSLVEDNGVDDLLSLLVAATLKKTYPGDTLFKKLGHLIDIRAHWSPDEAFLKRLTSQQLRDALVEAKVHKKGEGDKLKKGELLAIAVKELPATDWVPAFIRIKNR